VDACVIGKVTREDEEKSLGDDGVTEDRGVLASLNVLELGSESFEAVEELGGFLRILGTTSHPGNLGVLEDGLGFEFLVEGVKELLVGGFPSGAKKVLYVPVLCCDAGGGCFDRAEDAEECAAIFGASWWVLRLKEGDEGPSEAVVVLVVLECGDIRGSEEF